MNIQKVIFPSRPQIDTICSFFILCTYGQGVFPNLENAEIVVTPVPENAQKGDFLLDETTLLLDCNQSTLDHHGKTDTCLTELVVTFLKLENKQELFKLRQFAKRDDLLGKGIISQDKLDKAFGLPGLLANLNKQHTNNPALIFKYILPLIDAHHKEEMRREYEMPQEIIEKTNNGKFVTFYCTQKDTRLKSCIIYSDNVSIGGYLRSSIGGNYDVVAQIRENGYITILTKNNSKISLRGLILVLRLEELVSKNLEPEITIEELLSVGTITAVPEWYYDTATNSLFNGTASNTSIPISTIDRNRLQEIVSLGISEKMIQD